MKCLSVYCSNAVMELLFSPSLCSLLISSMISSLSRPSLSPSSPLLIPIKSVGRFGISTVKASTGGGSHVLLVRRSGCSHPSRTTLQHQGRYHHRRLEEFSTRCVRRVLYSTSVDDWWRRTYCRDRRKRLE